MLTQAAPPNWTRVQNKKLPFYPSTLMLTAPTFVILPHLLQITNGCIEFQIIFHIHDTRVFHCAPDLYFLIY